MLAILAFNSSDQDLALKWAEWVENLGTVESHQLLIVHDKISDPSIGAHIRGILRDTFRNVVLMPLRESAPGVQGANLLFKRALRQVQASQAGPFLWLHPDAVPLREGWLDAIEAAWKMLPRGKHFLGCHLQGTIPHMSPVGVYSQDAELHAPNLVMAENNPFHLNAAPQVVPKMAATSLIVDSRDEPLELNGELATMTIASAALWHGALSCKTGELIAALRKARRLPALEIATPPPARENGQQPQKFAVPEKALPVDRSAQQAASRAGSDGIPSDEVDTNPQVPRTAPPMVNPVKMPPPPFTPEQRRAEHNAMMAAINPGVFPENAGNPIAARRAEFERTATEVAAQLNEADRQRAKERQKVVDGYADKHATAAALTTAAHEVSEAAQAKGDDFAETLHAQLAHVVTPANVDQFAAALADFRDKSPAQKAAVLASLRAAGFNIVGKTKKGRR